MGLKPALISLADILTMFFLFAFVLTSKNIDNKGFLRFLYAKPLIKVDGTVEYKGNQ